MKALSKFTSAIVALLCLEVSLQAANAQPSSQCIELSPDPEGLSLTSQEPLAGTSAYLYVERPEDPISGQPTFGTNLQGAFILKSPSGRLFVRVVDVPPGHGWFGPF